MSIRNRGYRLLFTTVNILLYLVIIGLWIAIPEETTLNFSVTTFNLSLTLFILFIYRDDFSQFYRSNFFKELNSTILSAILILSILGLLNYLFYVNPSQVDMTKDNWNSLSKESIQILSRLEGKLTIHIFGKGQQQQPIRSLLERYRVEKSDIEILFHDNQLRPDLVSKYKITKDGVLVLTYKGKTELVETINELSLAKAMARIARNVEPKVMYFTGLNNLNINEAAGHGGLILKKSIEDSSYQLVIQDIQATGEISQEVQAVIVWGPKIDLTSSQIQFIDNYLSQGGTLITAVDPDFNGENLSLYREFLHTRGIEIENNLVIDNHSFVNGSDGVVPLVQKTISKHPVAKELSFPLFLPLSSSVRSAFDNEDKDATFDSLISSSVFPHSWAESNPADYALKKHKFDQNEDFTGPISLAAAIENKTENSRIIVFGSSSFIINNYANFTNNFKLFTRSLAWMVDKNNELVLNLPVFNEKPVFISSPQLGVIFYFSVIFVPLILIGAGVFSYRRRQKI